MSGTYVSFPLNSTSTVQQTFPILLSDFDQQGVFMITKWENEQDGVLVELCYTMNDSCYYSQGTLMLYRYAPDFKFKFDIAYYGYSLQIRMKTGPFNKQGFVVYQIDSM